MKNNKWDIIHECDDDNGQPTCWSKEINHPKHGKYVWISKETLLYNFINNAPVSELAVLRHLLRLLILCWFRLFLRKWHKIPAGEFVRLAQTETPARFVSDI